MSIYTDKASELFKNTFKKKNLISPISDSDVKIVECLFEIIKCTSDLNIKSISDNFKYLKDEDIVSQLKGFKEEVESKIYPTEDEDFLPQQYFHFKDLDMNVVRIGYLIGFKKAYKYSEDFADVVPCIILNETEEHATKKPMYANHILFYKTEESRDEDFIILNKLCN